MRALLGALLVVCALAGCSDDDTADPAPSTTEVDRSEAASAELVAAFSYEVELGEVGPTYCPVAAIRFTDESEGDPTSWEWEFGDGTTSTEQHPVVHNELTEATLTITRGDQTDTVTESVTFAVC